MERGVGKSEIGGEAPVRRCTKNTRMRYGESKRSQRERTRKSGLSCRTVGVVDQR